MEVLSFMKEKKKIKILNGNLILFLKRKYVGNKLKEERVFLVIIWELVYSFIVLFFDLWFIIVIILFLICCEIFIILM